MQVRVLSLLPFVMLSKLLIALLFVGTLVAQQPQSFTVASVQDAPFVNCTLLGDTTSELARCTGCGAGTPEQKDDSGTFQDMTKNSDGTFTAVGIIGWESTAGGGAHLYLNRITITTKDGACEVEDEGCKTKTQCEAVHELNFMMFTSTQLEAMESLIVTISGQTVVVGLNAIPTWNGAWWVSNYVMGSAVGGDCGVTYAAIVYDPTAMDPHTASHQSIPPITGDVALEFQFECVECTYEAYDQPTHSLPLEMWYQANFH